MLIFIPKNCVYLVIMREEGIAECMNLDSDTL